MPTLFKRFAAPISATVVLGAYWPVALMVEDNFQAEVLRAQQATVMLSAFGFFALALHRAFQVDVPESARRFYTGLILWASAAGSGAVWRLLWRMAGGGNELDWMLSNDWANFLLWMEIVGLFFVISGPPVPDHGTLLGNGQPADAIGWRRIFVVATLCVAVCYVVVVQRVGADRIHGLLDLLHKGVGA